MSVVYNPTKNNATEEISEICNRRTVWMKLSYSFVNLLHKFQSEFVNIAFIVHSSYVV